jgi:hypothetical protein
VLQKKRGRRHDNGQEAEHGQEARHGCLGVAQPHGQGNGVGAPHLRVDVLDLDGRLRTFEASLETPAADDEGVMRPRVRKTRVAPLEAKYNKGKSFGGSRNA